jgi:phage gpG-like protein
MAESASIKFENSEWKAFLNHIKKGLDWEKILRAAFSIAGFADINSHFRSEQGEDGAWKAREYKTQISYANYFNGRWKLPAGTSRKSFDPLNKILQHTGKLRNSILGTNDFKKSAVKRISRTSIMLFSNVDYSGIHDRGGNGMPKREFMWLSNSARNKMEDIIMNIAFKD